MKKLLIGLSFLTLTLNAFALSGEEIYKKHSTSIIFLTNEGGGHGTGFFIHESGLIFTNKHVAKGLKGNIEGITLNNNLYKNIQIIAIHPFADVALLKAENIKPGDTYLKISNSSPNIGQDVFIIGNPKSLNHSITSGIISFIGPFKIDDKDTNEGTKLQHTAPTLPGSSGSPILNRDGEVVGIHYAGLTTTQGFNFGYHSEYLKEMLNGYSKSDLIAKTGHSEIVNPKITIPVEPRNDLVSLIRELKAYTPPEERKLGSL